jgi:hypothetical protein
MLSVIYKIHEGILVLKTRNGILVTPGVYPLALKWVWTEFGHVLDTTVPRPFVTSTQGTVPRETTRSPPYHTTCRHIFVHLSWISIVITGCRILKCELQDWWQLWWQMCDESRRNWRGPLISVVRKLRLSMFLYYVQVLMIKQDARQKKKKSGCAIFAPITRSRSAIRLPIV